MDRLLDGLPMPRIARAMDWKLPDEPGAVLRIDLSASEDLPLDTVTCVGTALCQDAIAEWTHKKRPTGYEWERTETGVWICLNVWEAPRDSHLLCDKEACADGSHTHYRYHVDTADNAIREFFRHLNPSDSWLDRFLSIVV